jgi:hypothetical protein
MMLGALKARVPVTPVSVAYFLMSVDIEVHRAAGARGVQLALRCDGA